MKQRIIYNYQLFKVISDLNDFIEFNPDLFPGFEIELYNSARNLTISKSCERLEILKDANLVNCFTDVKWCKAELDDLYEKCSLLANKVSDIISNNEIKKNSLDSSLIFRLLNNLDTLLSNIISAKMPLMFGVPGKYDTMKFDRFCSELSKVIHKPQLYSNDISRKELKKHIANLEKMFETRYDLIECLAQMTKADLTKGGNAKYIFTCEGWKMNVSYNEQIQGEFSIKGIYNSFKYLFGQDKFGDYTTFERNAMQVLVKVKISQIIKKNKQ